MSFGDALTYLAAARLFHLTESLDGSPIVAGYIIVENRRSRSRFRCPINKLFVRIYVLYRIRCTTQLAAFFEYQFFLPPSEDLI